MVCNCFIWVAYGLLKDLPNVWMSNGVGWFLGMFYCSIFRNNCNTVTAVNLPGTIDMHYKTVVTIMTFNSMLIGLYGSNGTADIIGKEGVIICIILFASPLSALRNVILTKSAASIPLPFTLACMANCIAWSVVGLGLGHEKSSPDFNIYFPNLLGLSCTIAQLLLKGVYGNRSSVGLPRYEHLLHDHQ
jgi:solute carrier family 50 protein (sugar transporter)